MRPLPRRTPRQRQFARWIHLSTGAGSHRWRDCQRLHNHLAGVLTATPLVSCGKWYRAMKRHQRLQEENRADIVVIAIWVKDLPGLYSAEDVAKQLGYPESGPKTSQGTTISAHRDEYLVEGDIAPDEHRILTIFEGGGPDRTVVFESSFYQITTTIPDEVFPGRRSGNALQDVEDEVRYRLGVRDAISGSPRGPLMGEIVYQSSEESFLCNGMR